MTFWLSFATDTEYLGAVIVDADSFAEAYFTVSFVGLNPGGEVNVFVFTNEQIPVDKRAAYAKLPRMRLLSRADLAAILGDVRTEREWAEARR